MLDFATHMYRKMIIAWLTAAMVIVFFCPFIRANDLNLQKAGVYTGKENIAGWVMSEKLDGIRGVLGRQVPVDPEGCYSPSASMVHQKFS